MTKTAMIVGALSPQTALRMALTKLLAEGNVGENVLTIDCENKPSPKQAPKPGNKGRFSRS